MFQITQKGMTAGATAGACNHKETKKNVIEDLYHDEIFLSFLKMAISSKCKNYKKI